MYQIKTNILLVSLCDQKNPYKHKIYLPHKGNYIYDIKITSHSAYLGNNNIYVIHNSIKTVSFYFDNNTQYRQCDVKNYLPLEYKQIDTVLKNKYEYITNFFSESSPLILTALYNSNPYLLIVFDDKPHIDYYIEYKYKVTDDINEIMALKNSVITDNYHNYKYCNGNVYLN